ncbi:restriction endonuclease subunit S [Cytobacillus oceanisediminis]|uniref:restriction endonuclease subunit S n=1 Tax=Cytobacillus oceanisediminis TaxID=665099 RepID=UPI00203BCA0E|nr:restriction endonuclease subunit S [Cytobacillus oceanisediminis]MCM3392578.1 restriction endonuclease subunit S [Cytobacillus oceanisediminis]
MKTNNIFKQVKIGDVIEGLYDGPHQTPKPALEGPVFLGIKNIRENGGIDLNEIRHISPEEFPKWTKRVLPKPGDIVFTYEATLHRYAIIPEGLECCLGRRVALIRPNNKLVDTRYLFYYFFTNKWRSTINKHILSGSTVDRIPLTNFKEFEIDLPSLAVQKRISEILGTIDNKVELNQRMNQTLEDMAMTLYKHWFVDFGPFQDGEFEESELGMIPKGWKIGCIGDIAKVKNGYAFKSSMWGKEGIPVIKIGNITPPFISLDGVDYVAEDIAEKASNFLLEVGDLLIGMTGAYIGKAAILAKSNLRPLLNQRVGKFVSKIEGVNTIPLVYLLSIKESFREQIRFKATGSAQPNISSKGIESIECLLPSQNVLVDFIQLIEPIYLQMIKHQNEVLYLSQTRDYLLPRLLSGKIELKEAEKKIEEVL